MRTLRANRRCETIDFGQVGLQVLQERFHAAKFTVRFFSFKFFFSMTKSQEVSRIDVYGGNLLKQLVQCLITVSYQEYSFVWVIHRQKVNELCGNVGFASARRTDNDCEARMYT